MPKTHDFVLPHTLKHHDGIFIQSLCLFAILIVSPCFAAELGDAARGLTYAKRACAQCHAIDERRSSSPIPTAPTFVKIANAPGMTELAMAERLLASHSTMPGLIKPGQKTDDLVAYLATLRKE